ncbi:MAG: hypothetical protein K2I96_14700 [Lachnospiraceae bacterium]|nr:hypothetical protein [Lachnospiraceae bacterium]
MGEIMSLIQKIQTDKDVFKELVDKMEPLIKKYMRMLYKDEREDVRSEMTLALWEAVKRIEYCEKDGECMSFLCTALKNRFYELYRKSRKEHDNKLFVENDDVLDINKGDDIADMDNVLFSIDIEIFLRSMLGKSRKYSE